MRLVSGNRDDATSPSLLCERRRRLHDGTRRASVHQFSIGPDSIDHSIPENITTGRVISGHRPEIQYYHADDDTIMRACVRIKMTYIPPLTRCALRGEVCSVFTSLGQKRTPIERNVNREKYNRVLWKCDPYRQEKKQS